MSESKASDMKKDLNKLSVEKLIEGNIVLGVNEYHEDNNVEPKVEIESKANIGDKTNVGAGTITCNYDGTNKHKTTIGNESFIGTNSSLVAPVNIGKGAYVGAGSVITKDVPDKALAVGRGKQVIKEDWAKNKK